MRQWFSLSLVVLALFLASFCAGCGRGGSSNPTSAYTGPTVTMQGNLSVPTTLNNALLSSVRASTNTDSDIGAAFASATVTVNGSRPTSTIIATSSVNAEWPVYLQGVPESTTGKYSLDIKAGRFRLKANIRAAQKDGFTVDSRTTAASLLESGSGVEATDLLATFPAIVSVVALQVETAFNSPLASVTTDVLSLPTLTALVASQAGFVKTWGGYNPGALVAYLGRTNDLDNDGIEDLRVIPSIDGTRISFESTISSQTSLFNAATTLSDYSDIALLTDFSAGNTRNDRTFDRTGLNFMIGLPFKKGAGQDKYLKLLVKRIDLQNGAFSGVAAEYQFVTTSGTAVSSGTKTLLMVGADPVSGAVIATDFLTDSVSSSPAKIGFISQTLGLGGSNGTVPLVRAMHPRLELADVVQADAFSEAVYKSTTSLAMKEIGFNRELLVGDIFTAYFPTTRHYALFKVTNLDVVKNTVTVAFYVNSATDDRRFF